MKLIFLDIDGVLNSWEERRNDHFLPDCVARLNQIVFATGAEVVLSSSWRNLVHEGHMSLFGFDLLLRTHGFRGKLVGITRQEPEDEREDRFWQIADYVRELEGLESYCILDDDPRAFGGRPGVQTDGNGLSDSDVLLAISILGRKAPVQPDGLVEHLADVLPDRQAPDLGPLTE